MREVVLGCFDEQAELFQDDQDYCAVSEVPLKPNYSVRDTAKLHVRSSWTGP
jgi:hypothetical protein